ncbi:MAG: hypothetical protein JRH15_20820, partial [Deltaproteobacteria bacterium]|nr:hypothetical protein [Deltaproteobacteria bacterium]
MKNIIQKIKSRLGRKRFIEAKDLFGKPDTSTLTLETLTQFRSWATQEDSASQPDFDMMKALWDDSDVLKDHPLAKKISMDRKRAKQKRKSFLELLLSLRIPRPIYASAIVLLAVFGIWLIQTNTVSTEIYQTATGELRSLALSDGSTIDLDTETWI